MTILDYAAAYETWNRRRRQIRRALFGVSACLIAALPVLFVGLSGHG
jgi:hypothetical protein